MWRRGGPRLLRQETTVDSRQAEWSTRLRLFQERRDTARPHAFKKVEDWPDQQSV